MWYAFLLRTGMQNWNPYIPINNTRNAMWNLPKATLPTRIEFVVSLFTREQMWVPSQARHILEAFIAHITSGQRVA